jgi:hypothetical protein
MENERIPNNYQLEIPQQKISRKTKNKMEGRCPQGCITDPWNTMMEETSWRWRTMTAPFEGCQSPEGAVDFGFPLSVTFDQYSVLIFIVVLLAVTGQQDQARQSPHKAMPFRMDIWEHWTQKYFHAVCCVNRFIAHDKTTEAKLKQQPLKLVVGERSTGTDVPVTVML